MYYNKEKKIINFSVGPVEMEEEILEIGSYPIPYFRTPEFSQLMLENETFIKKLIKTDVNSSRALFLTSSGTGAMEAAIINTFNKNDKLLIVNGGSFGSRFKEICIIHDIKFEEIILNQGEALKEKHLIRYKNKNFTGFLVNIHETSTGVLYDIDLISKFCKEENLLLVVDAISSFLADEYNMDKYNIDLTILSSQKALSLPPGLSMVVLNEKAIQKVKNIDCNSLYFNFKNYLIDGLRGQTPFTPAVSILIQLNAKLKLINKLGIEKYLSKTAELAKYFRKNIKELPFEIPSENLSNAVTPLKPLGKMTAFEIFTYLKNKHNIFVCPNGGILKDKLFRIGHIGNLSKKDIDTLLNIFKEMNNGGIL